MTANYRMAARGAALLIIGALTTGCGEKDPAPEKTEQPDTITVATTPDVTVIVHMTGALLMVPGSDGMNVLLPKDRAGMEHAPRLGFGIAKGNPEGYPCVDDPVFPSPPTEAGICYLNLEDWIVTIGEQGLPSPAVQARPEGVVSVTRLSGGHKAPIPDIKSSYRARVVLAAGQPVAPHCSLATWTYQPVDLQGGEQPPETSPLINVLRWHIRNPVRELRLRRISDEAETLTIPLPEPEQGKIEVILAHVPPTPDLGHLPPTQPTTTSMGPLPQRADHFDLYYDLLRHPVSGKPVPAGPVFRRLPHTPALPLTKPCEVAITTPVEPLLKVNSVATYACMLGWGGG